MIAQILTCIVLAKWFEILREPGEILSFYNRGLIGMDEINPILFKILTCSLCHCGYFAIFNILFNEGDILILPFSMVLFYFFNTVIFKK